MTGCNGDDVMSCTLLLSENMLISLLVNDVTLSLVITLGNPCIKNDIFFGGCSSVCTI